MWCKIGDYDFRIYLSFLIFLIYSIIILAIDLSSNKNNFEPGIKYYIIVGSYMLIYVISFVFVFVFLFLFIYSIVIPLETPYTEKKNHDPFLKDEKIYSEEEKLWKDKKVLAFISPIICFLFFILNFVLMSISNTAFKYLLLKFNDNNNDIEKSRRTSITIGRKKYEFEIKPNKNFYLFDPLNINNTNKYINFKEVVFNNTIYYLKYFNKGLKNQLCWADFIFPKYDEFYVLLNRILIMMITNFIFIIPFCLVCQIKDEITYKYFFHLIELGYKVKYKWHIQNTGNFNNFFASFILYGYIIVIVLITVIIIKRILFGGFSNILILKILYPIGLLFFLFCLAINALSITGFVFNILFSVSLDNGLKFEDGNLTLKFVFSCIFYAYFFLYNFPFIYQSSKLISYFREIINENKELFYFQKEEIISYVDLLRQNFVLESVKINELPKNIFFEKKINLNPFSLNPPIVNQTPNVFLCTEKEEYDILNDEQKKQLIEFRYKLFNTNVKYAPLVLSFSITLSIEIHFPDWYPLYFKHN